MVSPSTSRAGETTPTPSQASNTSVALSQAGNISPAPSQARDTSPAPNQAGNTSPASSQAGEAPIHADFRHEPAASVSRKETSVQHPTKRNAQLPLSSNNRKRRKGRPSTKIFVPGQIVWAKYGSYDMLPAKVDRVDKHSIKVIFYDDAGASHKCYKANCYPFELKNHYELLEKAVDKELFKKYMKKLLRENAAYEKLTKIIDDIDATLYT